MIHIYILTLKKNPNRKKILLEKLKKTNFNKKNINIIYGVDGSKFKRLVKKSSKNNILKIHDILKKKKKINEFTFSTRKNNNFTLGEIGLFLSWKEVLVPTIKKKKTKYNLVFEDDVLFNDDLFKNLDKLIKQLPPKWDILSLSWVKDINSVPGNYINNNIIIPYNVGYYLRKKKYLGTESLLISREGILKLSEYYKAPMITQNDNFLDLLKNLNKLNIYCLKNPITQQNPVFDSNIQVKK